MVAKRHHFVPKCYLESFSVKNAKKKKSNLYAFDAVERKVFRPAPDNVALQTDFNTIDLEGHAPDAFENAMASVESDIGPALVRIVVAKSLRNEEDRTLLLNLIGLLHTRNPRQRERFRDFREHLAAMLFPGTLRRLYIVRDDDRAGDGAMNGLIDRTQPAGIEAIVLSPQCGDFNEDLRNFDINALRAALRIQLAPEDVVRFLSTSVRTGIWDEVGTPP
jgi:hypothetical protein